jgi:hypothetical protein
VSVDILKVIQDCLGKDFDTFMYRYFTIKDLSARFDDELCKILPFYEPPCDYEYYEDDQSDDIKPLMIIYRNLLLVEKYGIMKDPWQLTSFRDHIRGIEWDIGESIYDKKISGYCTKFERYYEGYKTVAEAIEYFMTGFVGMVTRY